ncbi:MAG: Fe(3+) ABC transporter substrate-binding protein [Pseudomonadales bacterium]|nr:Fe(3+) ABC transporter substrate-binding protein [Pseudomonadales bacterium]
MARYLSALLLLTLSAASFASSPSSTSTQEVNVYSARKEALIKPLLDRFSEETGISVNLLTGKADALLVRLQNEGRLSPADLLITTDAGRLYRAKDAGLLQPVQSSVLSEHIPANLRDKDNLWFGLSTRARPIMYSVERVKSSELNRYEDLAGPAFKGRICIRSSSNIYNQSLIASMLAADGAEQTKAFIKGLVANLAKPPKGGDRDQIKAVASGQCDIAIANTYYLAGMLNSQDPQQVAAAEQLKVFWPNQNDRGTHINVSGAAVLKAAKHRANAVKLIEFLVSADAQAWYAEANHEYPVRAGVAWSPLLESWGSFRADELNLSVLGERNAEAVKLMDQAGWR